MYATSINRNSIDRCRNDQGLYPLNIQKNLEKNFDIAILLSQIYNADKSLIIPKDTLDTFLPEPEKLYTLPASLFYKMGREIETSLSFYNKFYYRLCIKALLYIEGPRKTNIIINIPEIYDVTSAFVNIPFSKKEIIDNVPDWWQLLSFLRKELDTNINAKYLGVIKEEDHLYLLYKVRFNKSVQLRKPEIFTKINSLKDIELTDKEIYNKIAADELTEDIDKQIKIKDKIDNLKEI